MNIKIDSEEELYEVCKEALHILSNLRHFTKKWSEIHGVELKQRKEYYENKADEFLEQLQVGNPRHSRDIKIEIKK